MKSHNMSLGCILYIYIYIYILIYIYIYIYICMYICIYTYTRQFDIASNPMTKLQRIWTTEVQDSCYVQIVVNVVQIDNVLVLTFIWNGRKWFL